MQTLFLPPLPAAGYARRALFFLRTMFSRRLLLRLAGIPVVQIEGRVIALRAVPLGVARDMVPAIIRCGQRFAEWKIDEALYDDFVIVLSLGLGLPRQAIERFSVPLWDLAPVIERIAQVNGLPVLEAGRADLGKLLEVMTSTGTTSSPASSPLPAGPGNTSNDA